MAQPVTVSVTGSVQAAPASATAVVPSLAASAQIGISKTYAFKMADSTAVNSVGSPVAIPLGSITKVRFIWLRVIGASVSVLLTSAAGSAQVFKTGDEFLWHSPNEGDQITALSVQGVADLEYILAGD